MSTVFLDLLHLVFEVVLSILVGLYRLVVPPPLKDVRGKVVVVTGAGHGIGRELALQFAGLGARVAAWDLNEKTCRQTCKEIAGKYGEDAAFAVKCNVAVEDEVKRAAEETR